MISNETLTNGSNLGCGQEPANKAREHSSVGRWPAYIAGADKGRH
jgi:hypothetical protein